MKTVSIFSFVKSFCLEMAIVSLSGCVDDAQQFERPRPSVAAELATDASLLQQPSNADMPPVLFEDAAERSGIDFVHYNGATGEYFLPEITGAGAALLDFDNDGDLDVYLVQGATLKETEHAGAAKWHAAQQPHDVLLRNDMGEIDDPSLRFTDVTKESGIRASGYGIGAATGDFNNDGWVDLYVTNLGPNQLWANNGNGTFTEVTAKATADDSRWSTSATFFDFDRDGWLDLYVVNYVGFSAELKVECYSGSSRRDYCGPTAYDPTPDRLFHNRGDGTFEDVSAASGVNRQFGAGLGVVAADFNGDGWTDVYVANDGGANQLWINQQGGGTFRDESLLAGVAVNRMGQAEAGMGVDAGDFDRDGDDDLIVTHLQRESNTLYVNHGNGLFEDRTIEAGLHAPSLRFTAFGTGFFDYDNDGWLDLLVVNGAVRVMESLARAGDPYPLHQPNQLFRNGGDGKFTDITQSTGPVFELSEVSRGAAFGDIDNDGDMDVVVTNNNGRARLLLNKTGEQHRWIGFRVLEKDGRRDALQSRVEIVNAKGRSLWHRVRTDGSFCSANDPRVLVGLGADGHPRRVRVHWTDGESEEFKSLEVDRYWVLRRGHAPVQL